MYVLAYTYWKRQSGIEEYEPKFEKYNIAAQQQRSHVTIAHVQCQCAKCLSLSCVRVFVCLLNFFVIHIFSRFLCVRVFYTYVCVAYIFAFVSGDKYNELLVNPANATTITTTTIISITISSQQQHQLSHLSLAPHFRRQIVYLFRLLLVLLLFGAFITKKCQIIRNFFFLLFKTICVIFFD